VVAIPDTPGSAVAAQLDEARRAAVPRGFHAAAAADQWKKVGQQLVEAGRRRSASCGRT
jgi:hypothetical protein